MMTLLVVGRTSRYPSRWHLEPCRSSREYKEKGFWLLLRYSSWDSLRQHSQASASLSSTIFNLTMSPISLSLLLLGASSALASPLVARQASESSTATPTQAAAIPSATPWDAGAVSSYPIHSSCNLTEAAQIAHGLDEAMTLVSHAKDHILRWGNSSEIYQKYFGNASTGEPIGWFDKILNGDKAGILFRCDDPDKNCATQDGKSLTRLNGQLP